MDCGILSRKNILTHWHTMGGKFMCIGYRRKVLPTRTQERYANNAPTNSSWHFRRAKAKQFPGAHSKRLKDGFRENKEGREQGSRRYDCRNHAQLVDVGLPRSQHSTREQKAKPSAGHEALVCLLEANPPAPRRCEVLATYGRPFDR